MDLNLNLNATHHRPSRTFRTYLMNLNSPLLLLPVLPDQVEAVNASKAVMGI